MWDILKFQRMLTPWLIQVVFWIGIVACVAVGIGDIVTGQGWAKGLRVLIVGPLALRILTEWLILFFKMNENLVALNHKSCTCTGCCCKKEGSSC